MIPMFYPYVNDKARANAQDMLESRWIGEGDSVKQFEKALQHRFGFPYVLATNSGTSALRLALATLGVGPGDEVITTPMTCTATSTPILEQFATPVFADVQWDTGNIDPLDIRHRITERAKAIICVHWAGYPCDLVQLNSFGLPVIEDAAHALGATYRQKPIGTISRFTAFSFGAIKQLTTITGGLLTALTQQDHDDAKVRRWFGIDRDKRLPSGEWPGYYNWPQEVVGFNYQMNNVTASVGLGNMDDLDYILAQRKAIAFYYRTHLANVPGVTLFTASNDRTSGHWLFTMHVERRGDFHRMMLDKGIETSVCHIRNDLHPVFGGRRSDLPALDRYQDTYISIPLHNRLSWDDVEHIVTAIKGGW